MRRTSKWPPGPRAFSPDGASLILEGGSVSSFDTYLQRSDGTAPVLLGKGSPRAISPDGKFVQVFRRSSGYVLMPTGPGQERKVEVPGIELPGFWPGAEIGGWFWATSTAADRAFTCSCSSIRRAAPSRSSSWSCRASQHRGSGRRGGGRFGCQAPVNARARACLLAVCAWVHLLGCWWSSIRRRVLVLATSATVALDCCVHLPL